MPRELRIMATVTLPDGLEERADAIVALKPALTVLRETFGDRLQIEEGEAETTRVRKPRQPKVEKPVSAPLAAVA
jgi:hypothetical protein